MSQILSTLKDASINHAWLTIGSFDGVHLGHQALIRQLVLGAHAVGSPAVVMTFHPHPVVILREKVGDIYLTLPDERAAIFTSLGVDVVIIEPFTKNLAQTSARDFIIELKRYLGMQHLLVGHDFALGRNREGNFQLLSRLGLEFDFVVEEFEAVQSKGEVISSSRIRKALEEGNVNQAMQWLGRPYCVSGEVIPGDQRGRTIGFPTANISIPPGKILPASGVYACRGRIGAQTWMAATNIGVRPTFDGASDSIIVETHLLEFSGDLYGKTISLDFIERLRGEQRFPDIHALVNQIKADVLRTQLLLTIGNPSLDKQEMPKENSY